MALMTLDHARDYLVTADPTNLAKTTVPLFLTRWVTHFCAPAFIFLAGVSASLAQKRHQLSRPALARRLLQRGVWLILLDVVVLPVLWWFNFDYSLLMLAVLWAIGWSMIALAGGIFLGRKAIAGIGIALIVLHNVADQVQLDSGGLGSFFWAFLHVQSAFRFDQVTILIAYPVIPWIGVLFVGYWAGEAIADASNAGRRRLFVAGAAMIVAFVILRSINGYGDPAEWNRQSSLPTTILSFLNCTKYPPSLAFLLMTLGPMLLLLGMLGNHSRGWQGPFSVLGRVPLFFYLVHIPVVHAAAIGLSLWKYGQASWWFQNPPFPTMPDDYGWGLPTLYAVWIVAVTGLVPVCAIYGNWKGRLPVPS